MVDRAILARKVASMRDAVARIREVLPGDAAAFSADRTSREVVALNLLVALQDAVDLAAHWVADSGWAVPETYAALFRYGAPDWARLHEVASCDLEVLERLSAALSARASQP